MSNVGGMGLAVVMFLSVAIFAYWAAKAIYGGLD